MQPGTNPHHLWHVLTLALATAVRHCSTPARTLAERRPPSAVPPMLPLLALDDTPLPRGVWQARYYVRGAGGTRLPVILAVDRDACIVEWHVVQPGESMADIEDAMYDRLDASDPAVPDARVLPFRRPVPVNQAAADMLDARP